MSLCDHYPYNEYVYLTFQFFSELYILKKLYSVWIKVLNSNIRVKLISCTAVCVWHYRTAVQSSVIWAEHSVTAHCLKLNEFWSWSWWVLVSGLNAGDRRLLRDSSGRCLGNGVKCQRWQEGIQWIWGIPYQKHCPHIHHGSLSACMHACVRACVHETHLLSSDKVNCVV